MIEKEQIFAQTRRWIYVRIVETYPCQKKWRKRLEFPIKYENYCFFESEGDQAMENNKSNQDLNKSNYLES